MSEIYPTTIVQARYGGIYEPGAWLAFPLYEHALPAGWAGGDIVCATFWAEYDGVYGAGADPLAAYADLVRKHAQA